MLAEAAGSLADSPRDTFASYARSCYRELERLLALYGYRRRPLNKTRGMGGDFPELS
jgi:hypothetical protein